MRPEGEFPVGGLNFYGSCYIIFPWVNDIRTPQAGVTLVRLSGYCEYIDYYIIV